MRFFACRFSACLSAVVVVASVACVVPSVAFASQAVLVSAVPVAGVGGSSAAFVVAAAQPGVEVRVGSVVLSNTTGGVLSVRVGAVGAVTAQNLGVAFDANSVGSSSGAGAGWGAAGWLTVSSPTTVSIAPGGSVSVPVSEQVPAGAAAGEYVAGVEVLGVDPSVKSGWLTSEYSFTVPVTTMVGAAGEVAQAASAQALRLSGVSVASAPQGVSFTLAGDVTSPAVVSGVSGWIRVQTPAGRTVLSQVLNTGEAIGTVALPVLASGVFPRAGTAFRVSACLTWPGGSSCVRDERVTFGAVASGHDGSRRAGDRPGRGWRD